MTEDHPPSKPHFRQASITSFFARVQDKPTEPQTKRSTNGAAVLGSRARNLPTDPWEELEERHRTSLQQTQHNLTTRGTVMSGRASGSQTSMATQNGAKSTKFVDLSEGEDDAALGETLTTFEESHYVSPMAVDSDIVDGANSANRGEVSTPNSVHTYPDWSGVPLSQLTRHLSPSEYPLPTLTASPNHTVLVSLPLVVGGVPPPPSPTPTPTQYVDVWDCDHVRLPSSSRLRRPVTSGGSETVTRWQLIQRNVVRNYASINDLVPAISSYYTGIFNGLMIGGLTKTLKEDCGPAEAEFFLSSLLPFIASLVIELPSSCTQPIPLLKRGMNHTVTFSQRQIASILANAFFCTFPPQKATDSEVEGATGFPSINFDWLFSSPKAWREKRSQCKSQKLKCLMNYFFQVKENNPTGLVSFTRRCLDVFPNWADSPTLLSKCHITHKGTIEDDGIGCLQVDFANKFVGGGVLNEGCVQEEIRFVLNPELIASRLLTECLKENECLTVVGSERFNNYTGYGDTFMFTTPHTDVTPRDSWGRRMTQIVAIDAYKFGKTEEQYQPEFILREINKAYTGFFHEAHTVLSSVATGNWGCGAFRGEKTLKFLLQLMASSEAKRDVLYVTFGDAPLQQELAAMYDFLVGVDATVGDIFQTIRRYNEEVVLKSHRKKRISLFAFIYQSFRGP